MLNRILLLEGLEQVAGHGIEEKVERSTFPCITCLMFLLVILLVTAACLIYKMWQRVESLERNAASVQDKLEIYNVRIETSSAELHEKSDKLKMYRQKIHRGLVKNEGYVDQAEFEEGEWKHWDYLQKSNRNFDKRRLKEQAKEYLLQQHERSPGSVDFLRLRQGSTLLGPPGPASPGEEMLSGDVAMVLLDSGEIAHRELRVEVAGK